MDFICIFFPSNQYSGLEMSGRGGSAHSEAYEAIDNLPPGMFNTFFTDSLKN